MSPLYEILLLASFILGIYLSVILFVISRYNTLLNKLLGTFTFAMSVFFLIYYLTNKKWILDVPFFAGSFTPVYYLTPAVCYLYVRCFIRDEYRLKRKDSIHFVPFVFHLIIMLPYLFSPMEKKLELAQALVQSSDNFQNYNTSFIPEKYHLWARMFLTIIYLLLIWRLMLGKYYRSFINKNKALYSYAVRWIQLFTFFITLMTILGVVIKLQLFSSGAKAPLYQGNLSMIGLLVCYIGLLMYAIVNPVILYGLPQFAQFKTAAYTGKEMDVQKTMTDNYAVENRQENEVPDIPFERERIEEYEQRITQYINDNRPYRNPEFNIATLSKALNIPQHHLSYIFKHHLKQSFVTYRNTLRVEYVKLSLQLGKGKELTLEAIGESAGFSSRSNFFTVFKNITGLSPAQYLESIRINS